MNLERSRCFDDHFDTGFKGDLNNAFVELVTAGSHGAAIVEVIISMAKILNIEVAAEGVETAEISERLMDMGCEMQQGYYFDHPAPFDKFTAAGTA